MVGKGFLGLIILLNWLSSYFVFVNLLEYN